jgi:hypothetical protein
MIFYQIASTSKETKEEQTQLIIVYTRKVSGRASKEETTRSPVLTVPQDMIQQATEPDGTTVSSRAGSTTRSK